MENLSRARDAVLFIVISQIGPMASSIGAIAGCLCDCCIFSIGKMIFIENHITTHKDDADVQIINLPFLLSMRISPKNTPFTSWSKLIFCPLMVISIA